MPKMDNFSYILRINTACQLIFASPRANRARLLQIFIFGLLLRETILIIVELSILVDFFSSANTV